MMCPYLCIGIDKIRSVQPNNIVQGLPLTQGSPLIFIYIHIFRVLGSIYFSSSKEFWQVLTKLSSLFVTHYHSLHCLFYWFFFFFTFYRAVEEIIETDTQILICSSIRGNFREGIPVLELWKRLIQRFLLFLPIWQHWKLMWLLKLWCSDIRNFC